MDSSQEIALFNQLGLLAATLCLFIVAVGIANRLNFFQVEKKPFTAALSFWQPAGAFLLFLSLQVFFLPLVLFLFFGGWEKANDLFSDTATQGWFYVASMMISSWAILLFTRFQTPLSRFLIWDREEVKRVTEKMKGLIFGAFSWFLCYPLVLVLGQGIALLMFYLFGIEEVEQVPVRHIKAVADVPVLYLSMIISMVIWVPIMEELLFRGFLQTWLLGKLKMKYTIALTSVIFASFHFSLSQSFSNVQYLVSLFLLSCFLGFLYEKYKTLWAPIGLHMTFNAVSLLVLFTL